MSTARMPKPIIATDFDGATPGDADYIASWLAYDRNARALSGRSQPAKIPCERGRNHDPRRGWERVLFGCCEQAVYWAPFRGGALIPHVRPPCPVCEVVRVRTARSHDADEFAEEVVAGMGLPRLLVSLERAMEAGGGMPYGLARLQAQLAALEATLHNVVVDDGDEPPGGLRVTLEFDPELGRYTAELEIGEFAGIAGAHTLEHLLLALPFVHEDAQTIEVGPDGVTVCPECSGAGCEDCDHYQRTGQSGRSVVP